MRWIIRLVTLIVVLAAIVVGGRLLFRSPPVEVNVVRADRGRVEETVTNSRAGTVRARQRARLSPEIGGRVIEIPFREGMRVRAGDRLLRLEDDDLAASMALAAREQDAIRARVTEACLAADLARREWERSRDLAREGIVAADILDRLASGKETAAAGCAAARLDAERAGAALDLARARLAKTVMLAPFDGVIASLTTELGEYVTPAPPGVPIPPIIDLIGDGSIYIAAPLDELDAARVRPGQTVRITLDPYPGREFPGHLIRVATFVLDVEEQNRTFEVEAGFEDTAFAAQLLAGTSADVEVILDSREPVLRVPANALLEGNRVLVVDQGHIVERALTIGLRNWDFAEVLSGLEAGEPVVVTLDRADVVPGARARIARDGPA